MADSSFHFDDPWAKYGILQDDSTETLTSETADQTAIPETVEAKTPLAEEQQSVDTSYKVPNDPWAKHGIEDTSKHENVVGTEDPSYRNWDMVNAGLGAMYDMIGGAGASLRRAGEAAAAKDDQANLAEELGKYVQLWANQKSEGEFEAMSPEAQDIMRASVTDPNFWSWKNLKLQAAAQSPQILSSLLAALILRTPRAAAGMEALTADAMMTNDFYKTIDAVPSDKLKTVRINGKTPFADYLAQGMTDRQARIQFAKDAIGMRPELLGGVVALANKFDPSGRLTSKFFPNATKEAVEQIAKGAVEGEAKKTLRQKAGETLIEGSVAGLSEGVQQVPQEYFNQEIANKVTGAPYSLPEAAKNVLGATVLGGALGTPIAMLPGKGHEKPPYVPPPVEIEPIIEQTLTGEQKLPEQPMAEPVKEDTTAGTQVAGDTIKAEPGVPAEQTPVLPEQTTTVPEVKVPEETVPVVENKPVQVVNPGVNPEQEAALKDRQVKPVGAELQVDKAIVGPQQTVAVATPEAVAERPVPAPLSTDSATETPVASDATEKNVTLQGNVPAVEPQQIAQPPEVQPNTQMAKKGQGEPLAGVPVPKTIPVVKPRQRSTVAETTPIPDSGGLAKTRIRQGRDKLAEPITAGVQVPEGARVLIDKSKAAKKVQREANATLAKNLATMAAPEVSTEGMGLYQAPAPTKMADIAPEDTTAKEMKGQNFTAKQRAERKLTRDTSKAIVEEFLPNEAENDVYQTGQSEKAGARRIAARNKLVARASNMLKAMKDRGAKLPKKFKDTTDPKEQYNPQTLLMMEAAKLVAKHRAGKAKDEDYHGFKRREFDILSGAADEAVSERRAEGNLAKQQKGNKEGRQSDEEPELGEDVPILMDEKTDDETVEHYETVAATNANPEDAIIRRESLREKFKEIQEARKEERKTEEKPKVELKEGEGYHAAKPQEREIKVEKKRQYIKPPAGTKLAEVQARVSERKPITLQSNKAPVLNAQRKLSPAEVLEGIRKRRAAEAEAQMQQARKDTNTNPTEGQKRAGNYEKGEAHIQGMTLAIETPKGEMRTGVDSDGERWSVEMLYDYGYDKDAMGADGDKLDVLIGPTHDASHVFVVDQVDPATGQFDEHKVMMSFADATKALRGYDSMFSDNSGASRVGNVTPMTVAEYKVWRKLPIAQRIAEAERIRAEARIASRLDRTLPYEDLYTNTSFQQDFDEISAAQKYTRENGTPPPGWIMDGETKRLAKATRSTTVKEHLGSLDFSKLSGAQQVFARILRAHLIKLVGDIPVHFTTDSRMMHMTGRAGIMGRYDPRGDGTGHIIINENTMKNIKDNIETILHEAVHAATVKNMFMDGAFRLKINEIMSYTEAQLMKNWGNGYNDKLTWRQKYGFENEYEFIAEALTNPEFQQLLASVEAPKEMVASMRPYDGKPRSMWDMLVTTVRRMLGLPNGAESMLEVAMRVSQQAFSPMERQVSKAHFRAAAAQAPVLNKAGSLTDQAKAKIDELLNGPALAPSTRKPWLMGVRSFDSLARAADRFFRGVNPVRELNNLVESLRVKGRENMQKMLPAVQKLVDLQAKYGKNGQFKEFANLLHDSTMAGVFADRPLASQKHIAQTGESMAWQRAQHPELSRRYNALPADLKAAYGDTVQFFTDQQNAMRLATMKNRIEKLVDTQQNIDGMAQRMHEGTETQQDKDEMGDMYDTIKDAGVFSKIDGPYVPLMRRGNYIVSGTHAVTAPSNATKVEDNEFQFTDRAEAGKWAAAQKVGRAALRSFYVDAQGNTHITEKDANGNDVERRLKSTDPNVSERTNVTVQNQFMEMFDSLKEAREFEASMRQQGVDVEPAQVRRWENTGLQQNLLSVQVQKMNAKLAERAHARGFSESQIREMVASMNEMAINAMGATRIQSQRLPRKYVHGASTDIVRNMTDYVTSAGNHLAKLEVQPKIDDALQQMQDMARTGPHELRNAMESISNEVKRRLTAGAPQTEGMFSNVVNRLLTLSFLSKLASPAYSVTNAMQPGMISLPYLASHYGIGRAAMAMSRAYKDVGTFKTIAQGMRDTIGQARLNAGTPTDFARSIQSGLKSAQERAFIDAMIQNGQIDTDAGMEVAQLTKSHRGILDKTDNYLAIADNMARQMPRAIEAINRTVVGLAAFRLEMARSGDVARATRFAQDTINLTQFNYSASNTAPMFNRPLVRSLMQFKKYGMFTYQLLGEQLSKAIHNTEPGDRAQAIKAITYTLAMHGLMAGALGLPWEIPKAALNVMNALGFTDVSWADVEDVMRNEAADMFGKDVGEMMMRGVTRGIGLDLSSRLGMDTLVGPFGEPKTYEAQDMKAFMWDFISGAPVGMVSDMGKGIVDINQGDYMRGLQRLIPIKAVGDTLKAARIMQEGSVSETTGKQVMSPYTLPEAIMQAIGFVPERSAESFERSSAFYRAKNDAEARSNEFKRAWLDGNGASRGRLWTDIQKWNKGQPSEARISLSDLRRYERRVKKEMKETTEGIRTTKRDEHLARRVGQTYNYLP